MDRWHGKHPIPWDMFNSFSNINGKDLSWYWNNWFFTSNYMDVAADKVEQSKTGYTVIIKNIGGFAIPLDMVIEYADGTSETIHQTATIWEKDQQTAMVDIKTAKKITFLKLDGGIFVDADDKNNSWGTAKQKASALTSADLDKYTGTYSSKQLPIKIVFTKDGTSLIAEPTGQDKITLSNTGKDTFNYDAAGAEFTFDTAKGEMTLKQGGGSFLFTKEK